MNTGRRKKVPRRRIVDLAHDETFVRVPDEDLVASLSAGVETAKHGLARTSSDAAVLESTPTEFLIDDILGGSTKAPSVESSEPSQQRGRLPG